MWPHNNMSMSTSTPLQQLIFTKYPIIQINISNKDIIVIYIYILSMIDHTKIMECVSKQLDIHFKQIIKRKSDPMYACTI